MPSNEVADNVGAAAHTSAIGLNVGWIGALTVTDIVVGTHKGMLRLE
jgi:hypothetical protein